MSIATVQIRVAVLSVCVTVTVTVTVTRRIVTRYKRSAPDEMFLTRSREEWQAARGRVCRAIIMTMRSARVDASANKRLRLTFALAPLRRNFMYGTNFRFINS